MAAHDRSFDPSAPRTVGRYHVLDEIGRDRIYISHLARLEGPSGFQRWSVVRRVRPEVARVPGFEAAFYEAARQSGRIDHPNVVITHDVGEDAGHLWIALEFLNGETAEEILAHAEKTRTQLPWAVACKIVADAALGVDGIHSSRDMSGKRIGLLHGHLAPTSLLVTYAGKTKVVDPCSPRIPADVEASITAADDLLAVLPYMAPEQVWGEKVDARADVFSLGVILWELCAGRRLFRGRTDEETRALLEAVAVPQLRQSLRGFPGAVDALIHRAVTRDPRRRYDTAAELARSIQEAMSAQRVAFDEEVVARYMARTFSDRFEAREVLLQQAADVTEVFRREKHAAPTPAAAPPASRANAPLPPPRLPIGASPSRDFEPVVASGASDEHPTVVIEGPDESTRIRPLGADEMNTAVALDPRAVAPNAPPAAQPLVPAPYVGHAPPQLPLGDVPAGPAGSFPVGPVPTRMGPVPMPISSRPPPNPFAPRQSAVATQQVRLAPLAPPKGSLVRNVEIVALATVLLAGVMIVWRMVSPSEPLPANSAPSATTAADAPRIPSPPEPPTTTVAPTPSSVPAVSASAVASTSPTESPPAFVAPTPAAAVKTATPAHHAAAHATARSSAAASTPESATETASSSSSAANGQLTVVCVPACDQVIVSGKSLGPSPVYKAKVRAGRVRVVLRTSDPPVEKTTDVDVKSDDVTVLKMQMGAGE